jgi:hypothetical protein
MTWRTEEKELAHERMRITQFTTKADGDDQKFRQLILLRATRCGPAKLERFIMNLRKIGRDDLASFIEMCMKDKPKL